MEIGDFNDILEARRKEWFNILWSLRKLNPQPANLRNSQVDPRCLKDNVLRSDVMKGFIQQMSTELEMTENELYIQVQMLLDEIGFQKSSSVIRALSIVLVKVFKSIYCKVFVNETSLLKIKSSLGNNPVLFLPTHRSYMDFIMMSYVCFTYDIQIPAIAAGMDFYHMFIMGSILRKTGAFYMRRQFSNDKVYSKVFQSYIHEIILHSDHALEFFIEGTRSRSGKSLPPKFGLLSMALKPFLFGEISEITIIPVSFGYDRILEEKLLAAELLGIPKPKESTSKLFKALSIVKENYGNIYVHFSEPISARQFFTSNSQKSHHANGPIKHQRLSQVETFQIEKFAYHVVTQQQNAMVISIFNGIATVLNTGILNYEQLNYEQVKSQTEQLLTFLTALKANVNSLSYDDEFDSVLRNVHSNLICVEGSRVRLSQHSGKFVDNLNTSNKLKGHPICEYVMRAALPVIQLQIYVNPVMNFLIGPSLLINLIRARTLDRVMLQKAYRMLRLLFSNEFVIDANNVDQDFLKSESILANNRILDSLDSKKLNQSSSNEIVTKILISAIRPFIIAYDVVIRLILTSNDLSQRNLVISTQASVEKLILNDSNAIDLNQTQSKVTTVHPYNLSLDTIHSCLQALCDCGIVKKTHRNSDCSNIVYAVKTYSGLQEIADSVELLLADWTSHSDLQLKVFAKL